MEILYELIAFHTYRNNDNRINFDVNFLIMNQDNSEMLLIATVTMAEKG